MRKILVFLIIIPTVLLSGCREKSSDSISGKIEDSFDVPFKNSSYKDFSNNRYPESIQDYERFPEDLYFDNFADLHAKDSVFLTPGRVPEDWIPFYFLKVKRLNSDQISQIYGPPIYRKTFLLSDRGYYTLADRERITEQLKNQPYAVIHAFVWTVDSVRELRMYCLERKKGVYTPVWGYQYNYNIIPFE